MALALANGQDVFAATITIPRAGAWHADLVVDEPAGITGACTLAIDGGLTLVGTVARGGPFLDTAYVRLVPGAGGLRKTARAQAYRNVRLQVVLADLLRTGGEQLAAASAQALLATRLPFWSTRQQAIGASISGLLSDPRLGAPVWRTLVDGTIFVGFETWPDSGITADDFQDLGELPHEGRAELGVEAPALLPGTALLGRRVSAVEHRIRDGAVRTSAWFEDG